MARKCAVCGKGAQVGSQISHAHNVSKKRFNVNLQHVRIKVDGKVKKGTCLYRLFERREGSESIVVRRLD